MKNCILILFIICYNFSFAQKNETIYASDTLKLSKEEKLRSISDALKLEPNFENLHEGYEMAEKAAKKSEESAEKTKEAFRSILGENANSEKYDGYSVGLEISTIKWTFEFIDDKKLIIKNNNKTIYLDIEKEATSYDKNKRYKILTKQTGFYKWHGILLSDYSNFDMKFKSKSAGVLNNKNYQILITGTTQLNFILDKI